MNLARPRILQEVIKHFGFVRRCVFVRRCIDAWIVRARAGFGKRVLRQRLKLPAIHSARKR